MQGTHLQGARPPVSLPTGHRRWRSGTWRARASGTKHHPAAERPAKDPGPAQGPQGSDGAGQSWRGSWQPPAVFLGRVCSPSTRRGACPQCWCPLLWRSTLGPLSPGGTRVSRSLGTEHRTASPPARGPHSPTGRLLVLRKGRPLSRPGHGSSGEGAIVEGAGAPGRGSSR